MLDGDDAPNFLTDEQKQGMGSRSGNTDIDLNSDNNENSLRVDISDALSEKDKVKFTVHTKTSLQDFQKPEFSVVRQHDEFTWLHDRFDENEEYAGIVIPPPPPHPDFDASREKLQRLGEGEGAMTSEEFSKMKQELEAEYLATFKKTVAMHEVFLQRLAAHPKLRCDVNFRVFLEYEKDLSVRTKNKKERLSGFIKNVTQSADEVLLSGHKDVDAYFEQQKQFILDYHSRIKDATAKSDKMTKCHKNVADAYIKISLGFIQMSTVSGRELEKSLNSIADGFEKARKLEGRVATDEDLKLSDTLRYYLQDTQAAKNLLYRRLKAQSHYEATNKALEKARMKNRDVLQSENNQQEACQKFENISEMARLELREFKDRRIKHFGKNLVDLVELEIKHAKAQQQLLKNVIENIKEAV